VKQCVERYGRVDILHNNVGTAAGDRPVDEFDVAVWDRIIQIDLRAMALTCKYALPVMRTQQSGSIINVSPGVSLRAYPQLAYSCAKAGVNSLTQHVAGRGAPYGIRCNAIVVGKSIGPMTRFQYHHYVMLEGRAGMSLIPHCSLPLMNRASLLASCSLLTEVSLPGSRSWQA
jgi:NAD(P)-dependent dehydrogenase (short-subunit alcohol dehydrogenase family)